MSKIIAFVIVTALTLIPVTSGLSSSPTNPPPNDMEVMVLFTGLMVFHKKEQSEQYEVGVLSKQYSPGHEFCIQRLGAHPLCRESVRQEGKTNLSDGARWTFMVDPGPDGRPVGEGHNNKRWPDVDAGQYDFDWIVDLEGLHGKELSLVKGRLQPIITLPKARLFTRYKSVDLISWQGARPARPDRFGFAAEAIGFVVSLKPGKSLTLTDDASGQVILNVPYRPPSPLGSSGNSEIITISNVRHNPSMDSDFWLYYTLFPEITADKQFDFDQSSSMDTALNPVPQYPAKVRTCCMLDCTSIFLGTRTKNLE